MKQYNGPALWKCIVGTSISAIAIILSIIMLTINEWAFNCEPVKIACIICGCVGCIYLFVNMVMLRLSIRQKNNKNATENQ